MAEPRVSKTEIQHNGDGYDTVGKQHAVFNLIHFRNPHSIAAVITQMSMLVCAGLIVVGLFYFYLHFYLSYFLSVVVLVIVLTVHHFVFDRNPRKVPEYVKKSVQFSSSSSDSETEDEESKKHKDAVSNSSDEVVTTSKQKLTLKSKVKHNKSQTLSAARKAANLDKFLMDLDSSAKPYKKHDNRID